MTVTTKNGVIKMPDSGDTVTMHVVKCEVVEGQYGEQVKFTDTRGDALYLPRESADRQLSRIGFSDAEMVLYSDVDKNTLIFSRDPNPKAGSKPYWGIRRVVEEDVSHRPSRVESARAEAERVRKAKGLPKDDGGSMGPRIPGLDDVPPPDDKDSPYTDEDGMPPVKAVAAPLAGIALKETEINAAYDRAWQWALQVQDGIGTPESVQAGAATLLIAYRQAGIC